MKKILFASALMALLGASCGPKNAQPVEDETADQVRVNCVITVTPDVRDSVVALAGELVEYSQEDAGCIDYALYESTTNPDVLLIFETWENQTALDAHSATDHFTRLVPQIQELAQSMTVEQFAKQGPEEGVLRLNCLVSVPEENRDTLVAIAKELVSFSVNDAGCQGYDLLANVGDASKFLILETWQDQPSLDAHMNAAHFKRLVPQIQENAEMTLETFHKAAE